MTCVGTPTRMQQPHGEKYATTPPPSAPPVWETTLLNEACSWQTWRPEQSPMPPQPPPRVAWGTPDGAHRGSAVGDLRRRAVQGPVRQFVGRNVDLWHRLVVARVGLVVGGVRLVVGVRLIVVVQVRGVVQAGVPLLPFLPPLLSLFVSAIAAVAVMMVMVIRCIAACGCDRRALGWGGCGGEWGRGGNRMGWVLGGGGAWSHSREPLTPPNPC